MTLCSAEHWIIHDTICVMKISLWCNFKNQARKIDLFFDFVFFCFPTIGIGLSRSAELAVLRARVPDRQSGVRRPFVLEHRRDSTAVRQLHMTDNAVYTIMILYNIYNNVQENVADLRAQSAYNMTYIIIDSIDDCASISIGILLLLWLLLLFINNQ